MICERLADVRWYSAYQYQDKADISLRLNRVLRTQYYVRWPVALPEHLTQFRGS